MLCKLKIKILCSLQGVYVNEGGPDLQVPFQPERAEVYWLGDITDPVLQAFQKWEKNLRAQLPRVTRPSLDYYCMMFYGIAKSVEFEKKWS